MRKGRGRAAARAADGVGSLAAGDSSKASGRERVLRVSARIVVGALTVSTILTWPGLARPIDRSATSERIGHGASRKTESRAGQLIHHLGGRDLQFMVVGRKVSATARA